MIMIKRTGQKVWMEFVCVCVHVCACVCVRIDFLLQVRYDKIR